MTKESLSDKIWDAGELMAVEDAKQHIQNAQKRLKEELFMTKNVKIGAVKTIDKIFQEEFGKKVLE